MLRLRKLAGAAWPRRATYEVDWSAQCEDSGVRTRTRWPATDLRKALSPADAAALVRAADQEWRRRTGCWVGLEDADPGPQVAEPPCPDCTDGALVFWRASGVVFVECDECGAAFAGPASLRARILPAPDADFATPAEIDGAGWRAYVWEPRTRRP